MNYQDSNHTLNLSPIDPQDTPTAFGFDIEGVAGLVGVNPAEQRTPKKKVYLSRKQKKQLKREYKAQLRQLKGEARESKREVNRLEKKQRNQSKSISAKLKERDKAISDRTKINRKFSSSWIFPFLTNFTLGVIFRVQYFDWWWEKIS